MSFPAVLFVIAASIVLSGVSGSGTIKTLVFPSQSNDSYVELVPLKPLQLEAFTLCMKVATEPSSTRDVILFAYRTTKADELNVWLLRDGRLSLYLQTSSAAESVSFRVPELGALQTHLCVSWDSSSGAAAFFMDGRRSLTKIYRKGHTVNGGGKVILGQDLDSSKGSFDAKQSFVGEISDVNMWDSVLSDGTIQDLVSGKKVQRGNVFDWETTQLTITGTVEVINREI